MEYHLTTGGIIFMILGWGFAISLVAYCFGKVLKGNTKFKEEGEE